MSVKNLVFFFLSHRAGSRNFIFPSFFVFSSSRVVGDPQIPTASRGPVRCPGSYG